MARNFKRGAGQHIPTLEPREVDYKATPAQAEQIVSVWRETLDIEIDLDHVSKHLATLQHWCNGLNAHKRTEALWP